MFLPRWDSDTAKASTKRITFVSNLRAVVRMAAHTLPSGSMALMPWSGRECPIPMSGSSRETSLS